MAEMGGRQAAFKEISNYKQGRSGAKVQMKRGPAAGNSGTKNPLKGGGINRATQGK
jgi:hypothetical protein